MEALPVCREAKFLVRIINPVKKQVGLQASKRFKDTIFFADML